MKHIARTASMALALIGFGAGGALAQLADPVPLPEAKSLQQGERTVIDYDKLIRVQALPNYQEPDWVAELVKAGKLPPVKERLPEKPLVVDVSSVEGAGEYGGVLRHVSGARPQGWNWMAGNIMAWGGVEEIVSQCLVRLGPVWMLSSKKVEPLPQLATSWDWSDDGRQLTMHLIRGAKWSDGDPFDAEDVMFMWDDNISDPNVPAWGRPEAFGEGTKLEKVDDYTIRWTFNDSFPAATLYQMGYQKLCPGPSHILKPLHPKHNKEATYQSYINALGPDKLPWVTMGPWTVTDYKPNQLMVMRRNPYFYQVDEKGNQLPYLDEIQYKLSSWEDRTIQTVAGSADYTNMEDPSIYLESLRQAKDPNFPNKIIWGSRSLDWKLLLNMSTVCAVESEQDKAIRELNRNETFRRIVTQAVDRESLAQSLVRGPFITPHAGGMHLETDFGDPSMVVYYPYDIEGAKKALADLGFTDTNGDGIVNWPKDGPMAGRNLDINMMHTSLYTTDVNIAHSLVTMFRELGINIILRPDSQDLQQALESCKWDWAARRHEKEFQAPIMLLEEIAPLAWNRPLWHRGTAQAKQEMLPFEKELVEIVNKIRTEPDPERRNELFRQYNRISTQHVYEVGLIEVPGAIIINKRFRNVPPGTPILAYGWGEDGSMRERLWVPKAEQAQVPELQPGVLPGIQN
jgi:peptide/nickel transport system substrate-binding protein